METLEMRTLHKEYSIEFVATFWYIRISAHVSSNFFLSTVNTKVRIDFIA